MADDPLVGLRLDRRQAWPEELAFLLRAYPRELWPGHANLGDLARFWLARHDLFRRLARALLDATGELREGHVGTADFRSWFAPRLVFLTRELDSHHKIEDRYYFPVFARAERRLRRGFEVLANDHQVLDRALADLDASGMHLVQAIATNAELAAAADAFGATSDEFLNQLLRHLHDEEDLIIPLLLDRGEEAVTAS